MKQRRKIQVFVVTEDGSQGPLFLLLRRNEARGGKCQPVTGKVKASESFELGAKRELLEETGISDALELIDTGYSFEFESKGAKKLERVFAAKVRGVPVIQISEEHSEYKWVNKADALNDYLFWPENKAGLE